MTESSDGAARHSAKDGLAVAGVELGVAAMKFGKALAEAVAEDLHGLADKISKRAD